MSVRPTADIDHVRRLVADVDRGELSNERDDLSPKMDRLLAALLTHIDRLEGTAGDAVSVPVRIPVAEQVLRRVIAHAIDGGVLDLDDPERMRVEVDVELTREQRECVEDLDADLRYPQEAP